MAYIGQTIYFTKFWLHSLLLEVQGPLKITDVIGLLSLQYFIILQGIESLCSPENEAILVYFGQEAFLLDMNLVETMFARKYSMQSSFNISYS